MAVSDYLLRLSQKFNVPYEQVEEQYNTLRQKVESRLSGKPDSVIDDYTIKILSANIARRSKLTEVQVIPIGWTSPRYIKSGILTSRMYALIQDPVSQRSSLSVIVLQDQTLNVLNEVIPFQMYTVGLVRGRNTYIATPDSKFSEPEALPFSSDIVLTKIGAKKFTLSTAHQNLSRKDSSGYVDESDLRYSDVVVYRVKKFSTKGIERGMYVVGDETLVEDTVTAEGKVLSAGLTVWIPSQFAIFGPESIVRVVGTLNLTSDDEVVMNGICVLPMGYVTEV